MKFLSRFKHLFQRSAILHNIEVAKRKMLKASDREQIKYELELMAFRQQIRLMDGHR
jgi:hypothetical protein